MILTPKTEKKYISKLLQDDKKKKNQVDSYYQQALQDILSHLSYFIAEYGVDGLLTYVNMLRRNSTEDNQRFEILAGQIDRSYSKQADIHYRSYNASSNVNRQSNLNSMIGVSIALATIASIKLLDSTLKGDYKRDTSRQFTATRQAVRKGAQIADISNPKTGFHVASGASKHDILKNIDKVTETTVDGSQWSDDLWINNDNLVNTVQNLVTQSLKKGISDADIAHKLSPFVKKRSATLSDVFKSASYDAQRIVVTERARVLDQVTMDTFKANKIAYFDWVTQPGACNICEGIADDSPYAVNSPNSPSIPDDSHPNCRCVKIAHM